MNTYYRHKLLNIAFLLLVSPMVNALPNLGFSSPIQSGSTLDIGVVISGLGDGTAPSLGSYDLEIQFDNNHLSFSNAEFGDPNLGNQLDLLDFGFNDSSADLSGPGIVNIYEISFDETNDLNDFQADIFTLAILTFNILKADTSPIAIGINDLGDAEDSFLSADLTSASVTTVPVPPAFWLMASGLSVFFRKKR